MAVSKRIKKEQEGGTMMNNSKIAIVYYSRTGNTKAVAKLIQEKVGGELFQIETN